MTRSLLLLVSFFPFLAFVFFFGFASSQNRLLADDFAYSYYATELGLVEFLDYHYHTINGRILSPLLMYVTRPLYDLNTRPFIYNLLALFVGFVGIWMLLKKELLYSNLKTVLLASVVVMSWFTMSLSHYESWLWVAGVNGYLMPMGLWLNAQYGTTNKILKALLFAVVSTSNILMGVFIIAFLLSNYILEQRQGLRETFLYSVSTLIGGGVILMSPGTWARKASDASAIPDTASLASLLCSWTTHISNLTIDQLGNICVVVWMCLIVPTVAILINSPLNTQGLLKLMKKFLLALALYLTVYWILFAILTQGTSVYGGYRTSLFASLLISISLTCLIPLTLGLILSRLSRKLAKSISLIFFIVGLLLPTYYYAKTLYNNLELRSFTMSYDMRNSSTVQQLEKKSEVIRVSRLPDTQFFQFENLDENWMKTDFKHYYGFNPSQKLIIE